MTAIKHTVDKMPTIILLTKCQQSYCIKMTAYRHTRQNATDSYNVDKMPAARILRQNDGR